MTSTISTIAHAIGAYLPEITVSLRYATALIGFCLAADSAIHRMRRRRSGPPQRYQPQDRVAARRGRARLSGLEAKGVTELAQCRADLHLTIRGE